MKIKVTAKYRKYAKQAEIMTRIINSKQTKAELEKLVSEELFKQMISETGPWGQVGLGWWNL